VTTLLALRILEKENVHSKNSATIICVNEIRREGLKLLVFRIVPKIF
jgi:hypothetical protein